jgi:hypothetical protein
MNPLMAQPAEPVTVGAHRYKCGMLDATRGYPLYCKLVAQCGKVLASGGKLDGKREDLAVAMLGNAMQALSPELVSELVNTFGPVCEVEINGKWQQVSGVFALHFAGKYGSMLGWLFECVKANFADFLPPNLPGLQGGNLGTLFQSMSQTTSTGS